jgi:predicted DNA-binding protein
MSKKRSALDEGITRTYTAEELALLTAQEDERALTEDALVLARLKREAKAREIALQIQHGKTPSKTTVATQVRILEEQLADLKSIAHLTGQNISGILREIIAEYILRMREDAFVARQLDWDAGARRVMRKLAADDANKLAGGQKDS